MPQFDFLFQPMLIALAAGVGLVAARLWGGRGGALAPSRSSSRCAASCRCWSARVWDETTPHFPLYLAEALSSRPSRCCC